MYQSRSHKFRVAAAAMLALTHVAACGGSESDPPEDLDERIIGGFPARSPALDAIGALGFRTSAPEFDAEDPAMSLRNRRPYLRDRELAFQDGADYFPFCSGTLIAPNAVLTAEHCVENLFGDEEFLIGFDGTKPRRSVPIIGVVAEQTIEGGFVGLGSDVAVAILAEPITDIQPLGYTELTETDVGSKVIGIGYGIRNNAEETGQRYLGQMRVRGLGGNHALNVWGSLETYIEEFPNLTFGEGDPEDLLSIFDLLDHYEASVGNGPGNAQACFGDSGGPIAKFDQGKLTVYGVTSGGVGTNDQICDWGAVYATLGPKAKDTVDAAVGCGLVPVEGTCVGDVATRCATPEEGGYEVVQTDCSLFGFVCGRDDFNETACIPDPCEGLPEEGTCEGETAVRCSGPGEGPRRVISTDCEALGGSCGFDDFDRVSCVGIPGPSCEGNCGASAEAPDGSVCFCDDVCLEYGDCCEDYLQWCEPGTDSIGEEGGGTWGSSSGGTWGSTGDTWGSTGGTWGEGGDLEPGDEEDSWGESSGEDSGGGFIQP